MRNLATIQRVTAIDPIEGADRIVRATVAGKQFITQKSNNFAPGNLVVCFEVGAKLPLNNPSFEFLKDPKKPEETHAEITVRKIRGFESQGMILPLQQVAGTPGAHGKVVFTDVPVEDQPLIKFVKEGDDITSYLNIIK